MLFGLVRCSITLFFIGVEEVSGSVDNFRQSDMSVFWKKTCVFDPNGKKNKPYFS